MRYDFRNAQGFKIWDDSRSRLVPKVRWVDDVSGKYATLAEPKRMVNSEVVEDVHHAKVAAYPMIKLIVLNPTTVTTPEKAASLAAIL